MNGFHAVLASNNADYLCSLMMCSTFKGCKPLHSRQDA